MKNLLNLVIQTKENFLSMTLREQIISIGFIILPGATLILIFSPYVQRTIAKLMKVKTLKTSGKWVEITEEDIYKDLNWNGVRDFVQKNKK